MTIPESSGKENGLWRYLPRAWFYLTPTERLSIAVILGLLLLGLGARWWHLSHEHSEVIDQPALRSLGEAGKSAVSDQ
ncbi:MAG: hypothetical protein ABIH24_02015 [Verrucomicrobiota bacterium]